MVAWIQWPGSALTCLHLGPTLDASKVLPGQGRGGALASEVSRARSASWVLKYGPPQVESLLRTIVSHRVPAAESDSPAGVAKAVACDQNLAQFLLDVDGHIVTWSSGA